MGAPWLLAVFMEALQECCNYILLVLFITWIRLLSSKQRGAYFLVFSDSFASLFSIHGKLISSSAIVLSSLCKLIILASKFSVLWLECSQHKLWHIPISFSALVFVHWFDFQLVRKAKTQGGWCRSDPVFFSNSKKRLFSTGLCRARYLVCAKAEPLESRCDWFLRFSTHSACDSRWWI